MKMSWIALLTGGVLMHSFAFADVSYQETTQITGGSLTGMLKMAGAFSSQAKQMEAPVTSTVMIHESRMVRSNPHTTEIIDLDAQTITFIDHDKRTYSMVTFQQMQQQMAKAASQAKGAKTDGSQMSFNAHISSNGATRQIDGQNAKESLLSVTMVANSSDNSTKAGMAATSEMWLISDAPGLAELRRFNERLAKELAVDMEASAMSSLLAAQPGGAQALDELKKESAKMSGLPVLQVTRVGVTPDGQALAAPSAAPLPQSQNHGSTAGAVTQEVATGTATQTAGSQISRLGTFGRALGGSSMGALMHHAPSTTPAPSQAGSGTDAATAGVLLETQTQLAGFSTGAVDPGAFQIPAGYKAVASPMDHK
jgi:hypothetical protein